MFLSSRHFLRRSANIYGLKEPSSVSNTAPSGGENTDWRRTGALGLRSDP